MGTFFKENWIWIVGPIVVILAGVGLLMVLAASNDGGEFGYNLM